MKGVHALQRTLILGASGLVGRALVDELSHGFDLYGTYYSSETRLPREKEIQLDIQSIPQLKEVMRFIEPDIIISCLAGAFEQQLQFHKELAIELSDSVSRVYYFSTTNVFDGDDTRPHTETDIPVAESNYGKFKIECEGILKGILGDRVIIIRIPAIWGKDSPRLKVVKESLASNKAIDVYSNLFANNLLDVVLARQLRFIIEHDLRGIFHLGSTDMITHAEFYARLVTRLTNKKNLLQRHLYEDKTGPCYFRLDTLREDIPNILCCTHEDIISYLVHGAAPI